jgi:hypothetical protein
VEGQRSTKTLEIEIFLTHPISNSFFFEMEAKDLPLSIN